MAISVYSPPDNVIVHKTEVDFTQRMVQRVVNIVQYDKQHALVVEGERLFYFKWRAI